MNRYDVALGNSVIIKSEVSKHNKEKTLLAVRELEAKAIKCVRISGSFIPDNTNLCENMAVALMYLTNEGLDEIINYLEKGKQL